MQSSPEPALSEMDHSAVPAAAQLVEVNRGQITESRHRGHIAAVDGEGNLIASAGDPDSITYLRSSAKPFQTIPLLTSGAADRFGFTEQEVALACASHSGEPIHVELAAAMLNKIGLEPSALKCGVHEPFSAAETRKLREQGKPPNVLQNNCSGKHAGMLAQALHLNAPAETYDDPVNPVQVAIREVIGKFCGCADDNELAVGVDGCGVPVFGMAMTTMARMYARLVCPANFDERTTVACKRIVAAMTSYPELIGGTSERLDTEIMKAGGGRLISKVGAEGVYTVGVLPCEEWPSGLGLSLKIEDGDDSRARPTVVIEALRQLGVLREESLSAVQQFARFPVKNRRGDVVGEVRPAFTLDARIRRWR
ncbi:MAG TPA: asparaginase [Pyrinomonadaceae bacterium]|nr:asparaginase [Pyrinomonadaceae bacterium]